MKIKLWEIVKKIYAILIVVGMPLWFHNGYFDMIEAKEIYFISITLICISIFTISFLFSTAFGNCRTDIRINLVDFIVIIFLIDIIIGTFLSDDIITTLLGSDGWGLGTIFAILCILMFYLFSLFKNDVRNVINLIFLVADIVFMLGILNSLGVDPFLLSVKLQTQDIGKYLSTIGNINWYGEYCCLIVPMTVVCIINYRKQSVENKADSSSVDKKIYIIKVLYWTTFILGIISSVTSNSDCSLIGIIISFIYLFYHIVKQKNTYTTRISGICITIMALLLGIIKVLDYKKLLLCQLEELQNVMISIYMIMFLFFIGVAAYGATIIKRKKSYFRLSIIIMIFIIALMYSARENIINGLEKYFIFNDSWGTNRGYIWRYSLKIYSKLGLQKKVFGNGLDSFGTLAESMYPKELYRYFGKNLINAHNDAFQHLITTGIIGVITYYVGSVFAIVGGIKSKKIEGTAISLSLLAYLLQGLFNNFQPLGVVMSLFLFALLNNTIKE